jgi:hypothetical protein
MYYIVPLPKFHATRDPSNIIPFRVPFVSHVLLPTYTAAKSRHY